MYEDIGAYDLLFSEFKEMVRKARREKLKYLKIDMTRNKKEGKNRFFSESKNTYNACICESEAF